MEPYKELEKKIDYLKHKKLFVIFVISSYFLHITVFGLVDCYLSSLVMITLHCVFLNYHTLRDYQLFSTILPQNWGCIRIKQKVYFVAQQLYWK